MSRGIAQYGRLLLLAVMLMAGPLRAIPLMACAIMASELRGPCCCTDEGHPPCRTSEQNERPAAPDQHCDCCEVRLEPVDAADAPAASGGSEIELPAIAPPTEQPFFAHATHSGKPFLPPVEDRSGTTIYLLTARLRL